MKIDVRSEIYYQPKLSDKEWEQGDLYSFEVFKSKEKAKKLFPNKEIIEYKGNDIENPTFVDDDFYAEGGEKQSITKN